jgi:hypothetical protein
VAVAVHLLIRHPEQSSYHLAGQGRAGQGRASQVMLMLVFANTKIGVWQYHSQQQQRLSAFYITHDWLAVHDEVMLEPGRPEQLPYASSFI